MGLSGFLATESQFRPTVHAASRDGTPSLMSLPKDDEVTHLQPDLTRPSLTSVTLRNCLSDSATHAVIHVIHSIVLVTFSKDKKHFLVP